jgi:hypothetical protein
MKFLTATAAVMLVACATPPPPQTADTKKSEVDALRSEARGLIEQQQELSYRAWANGDAVNLSETYRGHDKLFSLASAQRLLAALNDARDADFARAVRYLRRYVLGQIVERELSPLSDALEQIQERETFALDAQVIPYAQLQTRLANEADPIQRRRLYDAAAGVAAKANAVHEQLDKKVKDIAHDLGFASELELASELRGVDVSTLEGTARTLLEQTDAVFITTLHQVAAAQVGLDVDKLHPADNPRLLRTTRFDNSFPDNAELTSVQATLGGLGLRFESFPSLKLDGERRAKKNPVPFVFPVLVPGDVRLSYMPRGGVIAYQNLFHEVGLGLMYASTATPWFELKYLGSRTVSETYGFALQRLLSQPEWVKSNLPRLPTGEQKEYLRLQTLRQLFVARRYASKILFELALHSGQAADPAKLYQNLMSRAYGYRVDDAAAQRWSLDHDPLFDSAEIFRAWLLEAMLDASLETSLGDRWFERKEAGEFLGQLWSQGLKPTPEEIAAQLHATTIDASAFIARLKRRLQ